MAVFTSIGLAVGASAASAAAVGAGIVGLTGTAISMAGQARAAKDAAKAQREASAAQSRAASVEAQRARIQQAREARIRRAQVLASGTNTGLGTGTSGIGGAIGSISSQMGANIGAINQQQTFADQTSTALQKAADANVKGQQWQMIGGFSQSIFNKEGGFTTIFGGNTSTPAGK